MNSFTRRRFLQTIAVAPLVSPVAGSLKKGTALCFSTLGCPDWDLEKILRFAADNKYKGIEIRGLLRQVDITRCPEFSGPAAIKATRKKAQDHNIKIVNLGSSAALHHTARAEREKNIDEAKRYIEIASELKCPFVRVFPNNLPKDDTRAAVIELIIQGLQQLAVFAKGSNVTVLLESHGDVVYIADLEKIMNAVDARQTGLIWDITNMWHVTREPAAEVFQRLSRFIRHVHIKDGVLQQDGKLSYVLTGMGDVPLKPALEMLYNNNYNGYYSFEWEKLWHPEIEEPEKAFAAFPGYIEQVFKK